MFRVDWVAECCPDEGSACYAKRFRFVVAFRAFVEAVAMTVAFLIVLGVFDLDLYRSQVEDDRIVILAIFYAGDAELALSFVVSSNESEVHILHL